MKLDKGNKTTSKKIDHDVMSKDFDTIVIFQLMANLEQCGSRIPDVHSVKLTFLFIVIEILNLLGANRYYGKPLLQSLHL